MKSKMKIFDSYTKELTEFVPMNGNKVSMYVCGPTVYDLPHLGHARCYITWDLVYRYLKFKGYDVTYARNITDVDDKILNKAKAENKTPSEIATKFAGEFRKSMERLNILPPDIEPKATENIQEMIDIIDTLTEKGYAYSVQGDVYFRVHRFSKYGKLSKQSIEDLESGARVEASEIKENPIDFALWKAVKSDDELGWDSPWGKGRPGWHIECSAMAKKYLGETIDIHAGGNDLLFPHHENEIAQSECANGVDFVKYWLHNGFVTIDSEKMSKSLGNFISINDLLEKYDANTLRFFILTNHYRSPVEFCDESLNSAKAGFKRLKNAYSDVKNVLSENELSANTDKVKKLISAFLNNEESQESEIIKYVKLFVEAMDEDFNTSKALAILFELAGNAQKTKDTDKNISADYLSALIVLSNILGFDVAEVEELDNKLAEDLMNLIIDIRKEARASKNWAMSDKIRDELAKANIVLKDSKDGTTSWSIGE